MTREELVNKIQEELDRCLIGEMPDFERIHIMEAEIQKMDKEFKRLFL